jgi:hypothetical protein
MCASAALAYSLIVGFGGPAARAVMLPAAAKPIITLTHKFVSSAAFLGFTISLPCWQ